MLLLLLMLLMLLPLLHSVVDTATDSDHVNTAVSAVVSFASGC